MTEADERSHKALSGNGIEVDEETVQRMLALRHKLGGYEESIFGFSLTTEQRTWSIVVLVALVVAYVLYSLVSNMKARRLGLGAVDDAMVATSRVLPTSGMLAWRLLAAVFVFVSYFADFGQQTPFVRLARVSTFTCWSWFMQGIFFSLAALASFLHLSGHRVPGSVRISVWILMEIFCAVSVLICVVVWFVLIPVFEASKNEVALGLMYSRFGLTAHNANVALMAIELLLNRLSFNDTHMPFVLLYGLVYLAFAMYLWRFTGVLYYFFLDYTLPLAPVAYLALLGAMVAFFKGAAAFSSKMKHTDGIAQKKAH